MLLSCLALAVFALEGRGAENPVVVGTYKGAFSFDVRIIGHCAYLMGLDDAGIVILDISDPAKPSFVTRISPQYVIGRMEFRGMHAFVSDLGPAGPVAYLEILDISDPCAPTRVTVHENNGSGDIAFIGDHALIADIYEGLDVFDISDPVQPKLVGGLPLSGGVHDVEVVGNLAYVLDMNNQFHVVDLSDPVTPVKLGHTAIPQFMRELAVLGDYAYVAATSGLHVIDVSNPAAPVRVRTWTGGKGGRCEHVRIFAEYAYVTDFESVHILDLNDPASPVRVGFLNTPGETRGIQVVGNHAYVGGTEFHVLQLTPVPTLAIEAQSGGFRLSWPLTATGWELEQSLVLDGAGSWMVVPGPYETDATGFFYAPAERGLQGFFRLRKP